MYCPVCGDTVQKEQDICNSCGSLIDYGEDIYSRKLNKENLSTSSQQQAGKSESGAHSSSSPLGHKNSEDNGRNSVHEQNVSPNYGQGVQPNYQQQPTPNYDQGVQPNYQQQPTPNYDQGVQPNYQQSKFFKNTSNFPPPAQFRSFPKQSYNPVRTYRFLSPDFKEGIIEAVRIVLIEPKKAAPIFLSKNNPQISALVGINIFAFLIFALIQAFSVTKANLQQSNFTVAFLNFFLFDVVMCFVQWTFLSILLYCALHGNFPHDSTAKHSVSLWFKVVAYLMVINSLQILLLCILQLLLPPQGTYSWFFYLQAGVQNPSYISFDIVINMISNAIGGIVVYQLLKRGFHFTTGNSLFGCFLVLIPQLVLVLRLSVLAG